MVSDIGSLSIVVLPIQYCYVVGIVSWNYPYTIAMISFNHHCVVTMKHHDDIGATSFCY